MKKFLILKTKTFNTLKEASQAVKDMQAETVKTADVMKALKAGKKISPDGQKPSIQYEIAELDKAIKAGLKTAPKYYQVFQLENENGKKTKTIQYDKYIVSLDEIEEDPDCDSTLIYIKGEGEPSQLLTVEEFKLAMDLKANEWTNADTE